MMRFTFKRGLIFVAANGRWTLEKMGATGKLELGSPSRATVYRRMEELRQDVVDGARLGADVARIKYRTALGGLRVRNVLDRLEVDHTPMDVILIDTQGRTIGRPWLTLAIDRASRMIMGFYISLHTLLGESTAPKSKPTWKSVRTVPSSSRLKSTRSLCRMSLNTGHGTQMRSSTSLRTSETGRCPWKACSMVHPGWLDGFSMPKL
ncbi:hypothetical protein CDEF62S_02944 [Castellaniella defragrans]